MDRMMTPDEVATHCGVNRKTVYLWRVKGVGGVTLHATRIGNRIRILETDLLRFLDAQPGGVGVCNARTKTTA